MKSINFFSIDEVTEPGEGRTVEPAPSRPVTFFGLSETGETNNQTTVAVENFVKHENAVTFFGISDETDSPATASEIPSTKPISTTVMVVEDDNIVSTMLKHLLERRGYQIEIASDGRRAAEMIDSEVPPALILLDVMLPFVDGFELIRQIRRNGAWEKVPIIMLTAKTREEDIVRALESGADDYIVKPFQPQELIARVKRFVSQS